jgi:SagB-type dehydrogenase family enzyme
LTRKNQDLGTANLVYHRVDSLYELFHENTKIRPSNEALVGLRISNVLRNPALVQMMSHGYNQFPQFPRIHLSREILPTQCSLDEAIRRRRSIRDFSQEPLSLEGLNQLLFLTYGVTGGYQYDGDKVQEVRAAPSGGALYPIELYAIVQNVDGLEPGVYHYLPPAHALEQMPDHPDLVEKVQTLSHYKDTLSGAAVIFVLTAVFDRNTFKYGDRGYRIILLDAGHIAQNLLLVAAATGLGAVPLAGFRDDQLSSLVSADGVNEAAVYLIAVGHPTEEAAAIADRQRQFHSKGEEPK